jgi:hypothetical protein
MRYRFRDGGHPPAGEALPPALGMITSDDAGKTWSALGELGRADFHAIQTAGDVIVTGRYANVRSWTDRVTPSAA